MKTPPSPSQRADGVPGIVKGGVVMYMCRHNATYGYWGEIPWLHSASLPNPPGTARQVTHQRSEGRLSAPDK
jgi:hypothetical protein